MACISLHVLFSIGIYIMKTCRTAGVGQPKIYLPVFVRYIKCWIRTT